MEQRDDYLGEVVFDMNEVPTRVPPDTPLAPQWYRLEDRRGGEREKVFIVSDQRYMFRLNCEPFEEQLMLTDECKAGPPKDAIAGSHWITWQFILGGSILKVAVRLGRAESPLHKEVAEYMLDVDSHV
ncbi:hypothetical protein KY290_017357 [Solanum tuberosum]|uniref:Uncharacterized protein n=1 Tax=Solanum tuberosum TaxID=4113 RepID=A0ABQ7VB24_SOLTU|nr:hypothetical protein KY290_017357 [Solanum tuberosum]